MDDDSDPLVSGNPPPPHFPTFSSLQSSAGAAAAGSSAGSAGFQQMYPPYQNASLPPQQQMPPPVELQYASGRPLKLEEAHRHLSAASKGAPTKPKAPKPEPKPAEGIEVGAHQPQPQPQQFTEPPIPLPPGENPHVYLQRETDDALAAHNLAVSENLPSSPPFPPFKPLAELEQDENAWQAAVHTYYASCISTETQPRTLPTLKVDAYPPRTVHKRGTAAAMLLAATEDEPVVTEFLEIDSFLDNEMPILRRRDTGYVNGTKLLRLLPTMTKGVRDNILRSNPWRDTFTPPLTGDNSQDANKNLPRKYQGVWIPLYSARALAIKYNLVDYLRTLLALNPDIYLPLPKFIPEPSPVPSHHSDSELSISSAGLVELSDSNSDDELTYWRREVPLKDSIAEKPYGWVKMSREIAAQIVRGGRGGAGRV